MDRSIPKSPLTFGHTLAFWWVLFLGVQQAERFFLFWNTSFPESPAWTDLVITLGKGVLADGLVATLLLGVGCMGAGALYLLSARKMKVHIPLTGCFLPLGMFVMVLLTFDLGYFMTQQRHLDFVFLEYADDMLSRENGRVSQAALQTRAEIGEVQKWSLTLGPFYFIQLALVLFLWIWFRRRSALGQGGALYMIPLVLSVLLILSLVGLTAGLNPSHSKDVIQKKEENAVLLTLSQNPLLSLRRAYLDRSGLSPESDRHDSFSTEMSLDEAVALTRRVIGQDSRFPFSEFPLVHETGPLTRFEFEEKPNILMLLIEGLDKRFLGKTVPFPGSGRPTTARLLPHAPTQTSENLQQRSRKNISLTPFLDRLKTESIYFENFFANGVQTDRGLFATFCSYFPHRGRSVMTTYEDHRFFCLPEALGKEGYRTEMVVAQPRDWHQTHIGIFMKRIGLHELFDAADFPPDSEWVGLGRTDGAVFDFIASRIEMLRQRNGPYFISALTVGTHHPFQVPLEHPEVRALGKYPDGYLAALRYMDLELERFFSTMKKKGAFENTVVLILGDHGRHEALEGQTDAEGLGGHFMAPLLLWMDDSLKKAASFRPQVIATVASQVDIPPTLLSLAGSLPRLSPYLGQDLGCLWTGQCRREGMAFLSSIYDDLIGLASSDGVLFYSFKEEKLLKTDLQLQSETWYKRKDLFSTDSRYRTLRALEFSTRRQLIMDRIWPEEVSMVRQQPRLNE